MGGNCLGRLITASETISENELEDVVRGLRQGNIVCMATDTVYGLSCLAENEGAVGRLAGLKGSGRRPFLILIGDLSWLDSLAAGIPRFARRIMARHWPGPLTIVFEARPEVSAWLKGPRSTVAVRFPRSSLCGQILRAVNAPIVSTSANLQGEDACLSGKEAFEVFQDRVEFVIDSGRAPMELPSTIVDVTLGRPAVLRQGTLNIDCDEPSEQCDESSERRDETCEQ